MVWIINDNALVFFFYFDSVKARWTYFKDYWVWILSPLFISIIMIIFTQISALVLDSLAPVNLTLGSQSWNVILESSQVKSILFYGEYHQIVILEIFRFLRYFKGKEEVKKEESSFPERQSSKYFCTNMERIHFSHHMLDLKHYSTSLFKFIGEKVSFVQSYFRSLSSAWYNFLASYL